MEKEGKRKELLFYVLMAVGILLVAGALWWGFFREKEPAAVPVAAEPALPAFVLQSLEGSYSMKMISHGETHYSTAVVKKLAESLYQISRITVYGPVLYGFSCSPEGEVHSEELGSGRIRYSAPIDKTTIRFEKDEFVCELFR